MFIWKIFSCIAFKKVKQTIHVKQLLKLIYITSLSKIFTKKTKVTAKTQINNNSTTEIKHEISGI